MRSLRRITSVDKSKEDNIRNKFYVFDVETTCLEPMAKNFVFGVIYGYNYKRVIYTVKDFINEFDNERYNGKIIFAHNAEFDLLTIFGNIFVKVDNTAIFNGRFISAKYKKFMFADSMNIYPTSVAKIGELLGIEKLENEKVSSERLRVKNITQEDIDYCIRDCEIVYKALLKIFKMTGKVKITLSGLAMHDFRHKYLEEDMVFSDLVDEFYDSYYGGRTEAFYIGSCDCNVYDINSMYPTAMANVVLPDVKRLRKTENCDVPFLLHCLERYEGMATITVNHKKTYFGYLPCRMKLNGSYKLVFPVGEFTTSVNFNELRFALESGVIEILNVSKVIYGSPVKSIFKKFIHDNFEKRKNSNNALEKTIYKLKMNSLYGRFGMRMKMTTQYYEMVPYEYISQLKEAERFYNLKLFNSIRADCFLITENEKFKNSFFSIPTVSSYITSEARVKLLKDLLANENNGVVYCDTDSIFLQRNFIGNISDELGDWKKEDKKVVKVRGLKNYDYEREGKTYTVIKGISKSSTAKETNRMGETTYETKRFYKSKEALRRTKDAGESYKMTKLVTNNYDKREVQNDGTTCPLFIRDGIAINSTKFIRRTPIKKIKPKFLYNPNTVREAIMVFFINGGKVKTLDLINHVTGSSKKELLYYKGMHDVNGISMDTFYETLPEYLHSDDCINIFQDVLLTFGRPNKMKEYLEKQNEENEIIINKKLKEYEFDYDVPF